MRFGAWRLGLRMLGSTRLVKSMLGGSAGIALSPCSKKDAGVKVLGCGIRADAESLLQKGCGVQLFRCLVWKLECNHPSLVN